MVHSQMTPLPKWLQKVISDKSHRGRVLAELSRREELREDYRAISRSTASTEAITINPLLPTTYPNPSNAPPKLADGQEDAYSVKLGASRHNSIFNRYLNIEPYDRGMVTLPDTEDGYFNGSWVKETAGGAWWIATQAPVPRSIYAFLSLCTSATPVHQRVRTIVQLTSNVERGIRKGHPYYPARIGDTVHFRGPQSPEGISAGRQIDVTLIDAKDISDAQCVQSTLRISVRDVDGILSSEDVRHFYFHAWPDHGVPSDTKPIIELVRLTDHANRMWDSESSGQIPGPPIMAHCSAGVGRTGTFIAISALFRTFHIIPEALSVDPPYKASRPPTSPLGAVSKDFEDDLVVREVDGLREQRPWMLQRPEQILFVYMTLAACSAGECSGRKCWRTD